MSPRKERPANSSVDVGDVFLHKKGWETSFRGFWVTGCAVRDRNTVYLALVEELKGETCEDPHRSRLVALYLYEVAPEERWGHQDLSDFDHPMLGACTIPIGQGIFVSRNGDTYASGSKKSAVEKIGDRSHPPVITKVRCIKGRAYAAGVGMEIFRRKDIGVWELLPSQGLPADRFGKMPVFKGFADVDGFSESDIYAAGGAGQVWHFDGKSWRSCEFPTKQEILGICCGGDGNVYVCGESDLIYMLSNGKWSKIHEGTHTYYPFKNMRWFAGKLWVAGEYQLKHVIDGKLVEAMHNGQKISNHEYIDEGNGVLLLATSGGSVTLFDGDRFHTLVKPYR
jgi:hypothetical protein